MISGTTEHSAICSTPEGSPPFSRRTLRKKSPSSSEEVGGRDVLRKRIVNLRWSKTPPKIWLLPTSRVRIMAGQPVGRCRSAERSRGAPLPDGARPGLQHNPLQSPLPADRQPPSRLSARTREPDKIAKPVPDPPG